MSEKIVSLSEKISWLPATTKPFSCDIIFIKDADEQGEFTWIFDVGNGSPGCAAINNVQGRKKVVISHFHPDHIMNLRSVSYDELFVSAHTKKYTRRGTVLSEPCDFGSVRVLPMPSSHAKGCLAMVCDDYAFLGDGAFCKYRGIHHLYNVQLLHDMILFLEGIDCKYFCLDHEKNFIQERESVIALYKGIYERRNKPGEKNKPYINVDDYFPLESD